ncbi:MAG: hypothetical protein LBQ84_02850, partial [Flavobacteriaceae bacterium]|nr:hypothetical protein [Flavobacteriaceae bacterium]
MNIRSSFFCLLAVFTGVLNCIFAQKVNDPNVIIKDHNNNSNPISVNCDYIFNSNHCITLNVEYPEIKSPSDYSVEPIPFTPIGDLSEGNEISIVGDDKWSAAQQLPFNFCFYGNSFDSFVVGDNGVISFNTAEYAGNECPHMIAGSIPNANLIRNAIFGAYHDMTNDSNAFGCTTDCGRISLYVTGSAPYRKAAINFYKMNHFNCEYVKSSVQIVLYETTNVIEVYIKDKPYSCEDAKEKRTLVGVTSQDNSKGISPDGRNTGIWETHDEAWRFIPIGSSTPNVKWYDAYHNLIGTGNSIEVCPSATTSYSVEVSYPTCSSAPLSNSIQINYSPEHPTSHNVTRNKCFEGQTPNETVNFEALIAEAIGSQTGITTTIHSSIEDANSGQGALSGMNNYLMTTTSKTFFLRVQKTQGCFSVSSLTINLTQKPTLTEGTPITICSEDLSPELIYLPNYNSYINGYEDWMAVEYFNTYGDALAGLSSINSISLSNS